MKLIKELLKVYAVFVAIFFIGRVFFYLIYFDRLSDISLNESLLTFIFGLRMDTIVISIILVIPAIFLTLTPKIFSKFISKFLYFYILLFIVIALFIESASFPFFAQYDLKPNYLFIEYLEYPKEVTSLLFKDYKLEFIFASILIFLVSKIYLKLNFINFNKVFEQSYLSRALLLLPILLLLFLGIRSSFGHRPVNISDALYSSNRVINEITRKTFPFDAEGREAVLALVWNSFTAVETGTSKPYRYDFSVCARWTHYGKGTAYCAEYKQASECRIDRFMSGRLWKYKDYKVVPCA
jgi:phosphoglycerol transferase MdoB-like AlkP superfamily enzyme